jgi:hypothetical protein
MIDNFRENLPITHLPPNGAVKENRIIVCVRKRPLNSKERTAGEIDVLTIPDGETTLVHEPKTKVDLTKYLENHNFRFDYSFDETVDNLMVYHYSAKPLVKTIFEQGMATCFAYGQVCGGTAYMIWHSSIDCMIASVSERVRLPLIVSSSMLMPADRERKDVHHGWYRRQGCVIYGHLRACSRGCVPLESVTGKPRPQPHHFC